MLKNPKFLVGSLERVFYIAIMIFVGITKADATWLIPLLFANFYIPITGFFLAYKKS